MAFQSQRGLICCVLLKSVFFFSFFYRGCDSSCLQGLRTKTYICLYVSLFSHLSSTKAKAVSQFNSVMIIFQTPMLWTLNEPLLNKRGEDCLVMSPRVSCALEPNGLIRGGRWLQCTRLDITSRSQKVESTNHLNEKACLMKSHRLHCSDYHITRKKTPGGSDLTIRSAQTQHIY